MKPWAYPWILACALVSGAAACAGTGGKSEPARPDDHGDHGAADADTQPTRCYYEDREYQLGERFPALDGCNTCICDEFGHISCTEMACRGCNPAAEPERRYVATSPRACAVIRFVCEAGTHYFANECGCGCEKDR